MIPTLSRRSWLGLSGSALLGCQERKSESASTPPPPAPTTQQLRAGPFSVIVPDEWVKTAIIKQVPMRPLFTAEEWKRTKIDPNYGDKPGFYNRPLHWAIRLPAATPKGIEIDLENADDDPNAAQILIHKAEEWPSILSDGIEKGPQTNSPMELHQMRKELEEAIRGEDTVPFPPYMDAHLCFTSMRQRLNFEGGRGIRMITQWMSDRDLMRKGGLHYLFSGMSDDDSCQIIATFPISLPGLPDNYDREAEHLGRDLTRNTEWLNGHIDHFDAYEREAVAWLIQHQAEIEPGLQTLDEMLRSLVVRHWE